MTTEIELKQKIANLTTEIKHATKELQRIQNEKEAFKKNRFETLYKPLATFLKAKIEVYADHDEIDMREVAEEALQQWNETENQLTLDAELGRSFRELFEEHQILTIYRAFGDGKTYFPIYVWKPKHQTGFEKKLGCHTSLDKVIQEALMHKDEPEVAPLEDDPEAEPTDELDDVSDPLDTGLNGFNAAAHQMSTSEEELEPVEG